jgi:hypothetical protein
MITPLTAIPLHIQLLLEIQGKQIHTDDQLLDIKNQLLEVRSQQQLMDQKLNQLMGNSVTNSEQKELDAGKDRKRLKERLKRAAMKGSKGFQNVGWLEHVFGICPGDNRMGKVGSRYIAALFFLLAPSSNEPLSPAAASSTQPRSSCEAISRPSSQLAPPLRHDPAARPGRGASRGAAGRRVQRAAAMSPCVCTLRPS